MKSQTISPFVKHIQPWILRKVTSQYLRAQNMFSNLYRDYLSDRDIPFAELKKLSEQVFAIKEDLHLIFKRVIDPQQRLYEAAAKYEPNTDETEFINTVGLIFHKVTVVRELKYVMEHYATDSDDYAESRSSYELYWQRIQRLFEEGQDWLLKVLIHHREDVVILSLLVEQRRYIEESFGTDLIQLLQHMGGFEPVYMRVARYFKASGWPDRAKRLLSDVLQNNPEHADAKALLQELNPINSATLV